MLKCLGINDLYTNDMTLSKVRKFHTFAEIFDGVYEVSDPRWGGVKVIVVTRIEGSMLS